MNIKVLGIGCPKCHETTNLVEKVVAELGVSASVEKVTDLKEMMKLGVMSTPAIVIDGVIKCTGRMPTADEIKSWLV
ncbi:thioredoxin family protein [Desulfovibrio litoralis]|uniref:Small redox-active disulfide protein 2 n=1 Tax=Desulfovibrio litoralis DSM 11393 TaxID=1121455 RepID=A0A1M7S0S7_9BACT|nr:thioredoxin family protein [Desulfovibrio litoralis]SHN52187.1 small redox-active disulfide protein 2 [Desulfovibrio litoralis DSM 11393]